MFLSAGTTGANYGASELPERKNLTDWGVVEKGATTGAKNWAPSKKCAPKSPTDLCLAEMWRNSNPPPPSKNTSFLQRCQTKWLGEWNQGNSITGMWAILDRPDGWYAVAGGNWRGWRRSAARLVAAWHRARESCSPHSLWAASRFAPRPYGSAVYPPLRVFRISSHHTCPSGGGERGGGNVEDMGGRRPAAQLTSASIKYPQVKAEKIRMTPTRVRRS